MHNNPYRQCLFSLASDQEPDWKAWVQADTREQKILFDTMVACNHIDIILNYMKKVSAPVQVVHILKNQKTYVFPNDMTQKQWKTMDRLYRHRIFSDPTLPTSTELLQLLIRSAFAHNRTDMLAWASEAWEKNMSDHGMYFFLNSAIKSCRPDQHMMLVKVVELLQKLDLDISDIKHLHPTAYAVWEQHVLHQHVTPNARLAQSKPRSWLGSRSATSFAAWQR